MWVGKRDASPSKEFNSCAEPNLEHVPNCVCKNLCSYPSAYTTDFWVALLSLICRLDFYLCRSLILCFRQRIWCLCTWVSLGDSESSAVPSPQAALACPRAQTDTQPSLLMHRRAALLGTAGATGNGCGESLPLRVSIQGKPELRGMLELGQLTQRSRRLLLRWCLKLPERGMERNRIVMG